ncbi:zinc ribbon-containing protein [Aliagarivorans taiwanensis]|uniref:zinc ribbon-containing protein n=1 Tax=Aliagarivorans taiwanensis TaxID=561966 RepID=UPI0003FEE503|nr:hypothetical protein [Aliagarivorans taiwanensis]
MPKRIKAYQAFVEDLSKRLQQAGKISQEELSHLIDTTQKYMQAASDLTKDEWQMIANYVRRDLSDWQDDNRRAFEGSPGMRLLSDSIWHWLAKMSDTTRVEWHELLGDLQHQGVYQQGELVGLGTVECTECGTKRAVWHPELLAACDNCGGTQFYRLPPSAEPMQE